MRPCRCWLPAVCIPPAMSRRVLASSTAKSLRMAPLDNGHLQVVYSAEIPLVRTKEIAGARLVLGLNGHCLVVDFPPVPGAHFNQAGKLKLEGGPEDFLLSSIARYAVLPIDVPARASHAQASGSSPRPVRSFTHCSSARGESADSYLGPLNPAVQSGRSLVRPSQ
jgi:hypothetical protein